MKNIVIGLGEVGKAIQEILSCEGHDPFKKIIYSGTCDVIHVCIPHSDKFIEIVKEYKKQFKPSLTIIHSSVPVGTTEKLNAVHSPIRGVHPNLALGVKIFVKFFGGKRSCEASKIFSDLGIKTFCVEDSRNTEALKLWDTTQYGIMILLNKEIHKYCEENNLDFDVVYGLGNSTYNEGYVNLGRHEVVRPYLKYMEGKIGGHCVVPNAKLIKSQLSKLIVDFNENL